MSIPEVYKRTSLAILGISLIHLLIFNMDDLGSGLGLLLLVNTGFHEAYYFISVVPAVQVRRMKQSSRGMGNLYEGVIKLMGAMAVFASVAVGGRIVFVSIKDE